MLTKISFPIYCIFSVLFFLCVNHFDGFAQDAILYTLQAIHYISPERFIGDIAFMYGNQDEFTLFSPLYCIFIKLFPIDNAAFIFSLSIHVFFAFSAAVFVWKLTNYLHCNRLAIIIILTFFALYSYGEERNIFLFTIKTIEAFPVPRTLSAAFGFLGLVFLKYKWKSIPLFIIGTLIHPLTAGWCLPLWVCFHFPKTRIPILLFSALFPLTIFIGKEPWTASPKEWIDITFNKDVQEQLKNMLLYQAFFTMMAFMTKSPLMIKKMLLSLCIILGIANYWFIVAIFTHHIFLYQVQVFRIQWICQLFAVFISVWQAIQIWIKTIRKNKPLCFFQKIFIISLIIIWIDSSFILSLIIFSFFYLWCKKHNVLSIYRDTTLIICLYCITLSTYWIYGFTPCPKPELSYADKLLVIKHLYALAAAIILILGISTPKLKSLGYGFFLLSVCAISYAWAILPNENFGIAYVLATLLFFIFSMQYKNKLTKIYIFAIIFIAISCFISLNYDHRSSVQKKREYAMNQFLQEPPFPYIINRGKILYSVFDYAEHIPRLRFLSGAYFDLQISVGAIFSKQHKIETTSHQLHIFGINSIQDSLWIKLDKYEKIEILNTILSNKDSLQSCVKRLCQANEITHLISDLRMPFVASDSLTLWYKEEKIWLYPCMKQKDTTETQIETSYINNIE